jgi:hypothetical protein
MSLLQHRLVCLLAEREGGNAMILNRAGRDLLVGLRHEAHGVDGARGA